METKRILVQTFGCQQNEADSETLLGIAAARGYLPTDDAEEADVIVFNTCAVREHAELKALSTTGQLKHLKEKKKNLKIVLCGCMVQQEHRIADIKNKYPYVDALFGTNMIGRFDRVLAHLESNKKRLFLVEDYTQNPGDVCEGLPKFRRESFRAGVSVMYGCNNFCTYCVVPYVRGRERSRLPEDIEKEVRQLVKDGCREITLLGQNVNSYGKDLENACSFSDLLKRLSAIEGDFILKFMTSHPKDATHELIDTIADNPKCERHFHLPLQAGSDGILRRMNRRYTLDTFVGLVDYMREKIPSISITTDIIVGFPGESEEDFEKTLDAMRRCRFDGVFSFVYSPRKGTPAAEMDGRIPKEVTKERMARLLALQQEIQNDANAHFVGKVVRCLCEGESKTDPEWFSARTDTGRLVHFPKPKNFDPTGSFIDLTIKEAHAIMLIGEIKL